MKLGELFNVKGRRAVVTGGNSGIGRAFAEVYAEAGMRLLLVDQNPAVAQTAKQLGAQHMVVDLLDRRALRPAFQGAVQTLGGLDLLANCAGFNHRLPFEQVAEEDWHRVIDIHLNTVFVLCQEAVRHMLAQGSGGKIINIASMLSFFGGNGVAAYSAAKGAVMQLTKSLSNEYAGRGICVNALAPGFVETEMTRVVKEKDPQRYADTEKRIPLGRWATPEDMKGAALFMASPASDYMTGTILPLDGGYGVR